MDLTRSRLAGTSRALLAAALLALVGMPLADTLHQLEHLREDRAPAGQQKQGQVKPICMVCAAFTAAGHALPASLQLAVASHEVEAATPRLALGSLPRFVQSYLERAPPVSLVSA